MHDILKERVWRKLDVLPEAQLYQVLDYIEFLEAKYAAERARRPDPLQQFAERLEDGMRARSVAPKVILGTVGVIGTARRMAREVADASREILGIDDQSSRPPRSAPGSGSKSTTKGNGE
jgi:hypothetical protein